ncbi:hypothetical protein F4802DRAFT_589096 [Xylaria palmicola]|nr:hypothetical protein F4802DRAFT_589096 [Xylaria palmicola]
MGRPPAYIFVVRHGHRLDAADKQWHLSSPTPYDPPLTYGGWMHSRTVGARIAAILRDDAADSSASSASSGPSAGSSSSPSSHPPSSSSSSSSSSSPSPTSTSSLSSSSSKRRRFRIVLHSSPFLRCVQTSIAISAALASNPISSPADVADADLVLPQPDTLRLAQASSFSNPVPSKTRPHVPVSAPASASAHAPDHGHIEKFVLRLDPFLGEWLAPEYFEHITPPPKSALMLATAKAELLRRSSYHDFPYFHARGHSAVSTHLWSNTPNRNGVSATSPAHGLNGTSSSSFESLAHLADSLPGYEDSSNGRTDPKGARGPSHENHRAPGYVFLVPSYALSTSEPIPRGYVAHARDACVSVDYQWDSSRECLAWGDGGTLPEEWASMHQRFRRGLRRLVDWYGSTENASEMVTQTARTSSHPPEPDCAIDDGQDYEIEDVVVLVSHGAGCNALIGAITQQPVLADVAMSSLTMAKRRADFDAANFGLSSEGLSLSSDPSLALPRAAMPDMYDLKLFANTDHLAPPSSAPLNRPSPLPRSTTGPRLGAGYTSALQSINFGSLYGNPPSSPRDSSANASLGSMRRPPGGSAMVMGPSIQNTNTEGFNIGSGLSSFPITRPDRSGSGTWGLWSPRQDNIDQDEEPEMPMFLDFSHEKTTKQQETSEMTRESEKSTPRIDAPKLASAATAVDGKRKAQDHDHELHHDEEHDRFDESPIPHLWAGTGNGGLWGAPRPPGEAERIRDFSASKRRWTVTER